MRFSSWLSRRRIITAAAAVALATCVVAPRAVRAADDKVDDPRYQAWSKFKVGSSETLSGQMTMQGQMQMQMPMEVTTTLVDLTPEAATIERKATVTIMGQPRTSQPRKDTIPAKSPKMDVQDKGEQDVEAMGKTFHCKVYAMTITADRMGPGGGRGRGPGRGGPGGGGPGGGGPGANGPGANGQLAQPGEGGDQPGPGGPGGGPGGPGAGQGVKANATFYVNDDVPGGLVKMTVDVPSNNAHQELLLKSYESK